MSVRQGDNESRVTAMVWRRGGFGSPTVTVTECSERAATDRSAQPLAGVRVVDATNGPMAAISAMLAEFGADVVRIGSPAPSASAARSAMGDLADNLGKRGIVLDLATARDRRIFDEILVAADALIEDTRPGSSAHRTLNAAAIHQADPRLVVVSISDFGLNGAFTGWQATGPVLEAMSGALASSGLSGRRPLLPPGDLSSASAVPHITCQVLLALINRLQGGVGDHLDVSLLDAVALSLDPGYGMGGSAASAVAPADAPRGRLDARYMYPTFSCRDGHVRLCVLKPSQWHGMFEWMGRPAQFADPSFEMLQKRFSSPALMQAIATFVADKCRGELEEAGQRHNVPVAGVRSLAEALASEQVVARNAISVNLVGAFLGMSAAVDALKRHAPAPIINIYSTAGWRRLGFCRR